MSPLLLAGWLLAAPASPPDTVVELRRGDRVVVENVGGELRIEAWSRSQLEVSRRDGEDGELTATRSGSRVVVSGPERRRRSVDVDAVLRVPEWADVEIRGRSVDVWIVGTGGAVDVRNVAGDIQVERTTGALALTSVEGEIHVRQARGSVTARSRGDGIRLVDVDGNVQASTGSGDIRLEDVRASSVEVETLDGDVFFSGALQTGGRYRFSVHDGDATLELPRSTSADVRVATFDGEFTSDFPVLLQRFGGGGTMEFTLGGGGADLEIEVFDGEINLREGSAR